MKILLWIIFTSLSISAIGSDLAISSTITSPVSGCNLTNSELVKITILNADNVPFSGTFDVSYTLGATTVTESITIPVLPTSATYIYEFTATIDLSLCDIHDITLTVTDPNDVNLSNNSITVSITNDCTPTAGSFTGPTAVCETGNSGQIIINGNSGAITDWAYSDNGGATLTSIGNTTNMQAYNDITIDRIYRVYYDSFYGLCPPDSIDYSISVDAASNGGILTSDSSHCDTILPTTLFLNGYTGAILHYKLSLNGGTSYTTYSNPFDTLEYIEYGTSFQFFAITQNGSCPADSSTIAFINLLTSANAGEITGEDSLCAGEGDIDLDLTNFDGSIVDWEYTLNNGTTWTSTGLTASNISLSNINSDVQIRVIVEKLPCDNDTALFEVTVLSPSDAGNVVGSNTFCTNINSGFVHTSGIIGEIIGWISTTDNGNSFTTVNDQNDTLFYTNLSQTVSYAVIVQSADCLPDTSNFATITLASGSLAGNIIVSDSICPSIDGIPFFLENNVGSVVDWEYSLDNGATWVSTGQSDSSIVQFDLYGNVTVRVIVQNLPCLADTSHASTYVHGPFEILALEDTIKFGDSIALVANTTGVDYDWSPNIYISNNKVSNPKVSPPINTVYEATITDISGCQFNSTHSIIVLENEVPLIVHNLVTPNGDGFNDTWLIKNIELFPNNSVLVFNSYGQIIYQASSYNNNWDVAADNLPNGTYFYSIEIEPGQQPIKGTFSIIDSK